MVLEVSLDELSVLLLFLAVVLSILLGSKNINPDVPYTRTLSQSDVSKTRDKDETAIYRSRLSYGGLRTNWDGAKTLYEVFQRILAKSPSRPFLGFRLQGGGFSWQTYDQIAQRATHLGSGLISLGLLPGPQSVVGLWIKGSVEWFIADMACISYSIATVGLHDTFRVGDIEKVIGETKLSAIVCTADQAQELLKLKKLGTLRHIILISRPLKPIEPQERVQIHLLSELEQAGKKTTIPHVAPTPGSLATISYTAGTTGAPKAVTLTHTNLVSSIISFVSAWPPTKGTPIADLTLYSSLSPANTIERVSLLAVAGLGGKIGFGNDQVNIFDDIIDLKPTHFILLPLHANLIYRKISNLIDDSGFRKKLFQFAYDQKIRALRQGRLQKSLLWDKLIFSQIREILGGNLQFLITTSEPIAPELMDFLRVSLGCGVFEGYNVTEASGFVTMTIHGDYQPDHLGAPLANVEMKLVDVPELFMFASDKPNPRGEICIKGPSVFKQCLEKNEVSKQVLDENGWFHTGDLGAWLPNRTLKFIDRRANVIHLGPESIIFLGQLENIYSRSSYVFQISVIYSPSKGLTGVVVPNSEALLDWSKEKGLAGDLPFLTQQKVVQEEVLRSLLAVATQEGLSETARLSRVILDPTSFASRGFLSPTLQVRRSLVEREFRSQLEA